MVRCPFNSTFNVLRDPLQELPFKRIDEVTALTEDLKRRRMQLHEAFFVEIREAQGHNFCGCAEKRRLEERLEDIANGFAKEQYVNY